MRLLPRFNMKREVWPGGPQLGQVVEAQLNPPANAPAAAAAVAASAPPDAAEQPDEGEDTSAIELLLLLR